MENETTLNYEQVQTHVMFAEPNQIEENPIVEEPKKLSLSDINPSDLTAKIETFFCEKLETLESKFQNDLVIVEPFKFQFIDLYHDLENLKQEILDFLKKEEEKKLTLKKPAAAGAKAITRNNTSRSRTPIKFNATSKLASAKDVTKSTNLKGDLDKSRSRTPLTTAKPNDKSRKEISVSKTETKKTLHTTANAASTLNTTRAQNTAKKPAALNASAKKRDLTPVAISKAAKALDTSVISHNEPAHTEHSNNNLKNAKLGKTTGIKGDAKVNVASATLKKPAAAGLNGNESGNNSKRKSAVNLTSGAGAEGQPPVSSFNSSVDLTGKKKSILGGGLNISASSDIAAQGYSSNNNLVVDVNHNNNNIDNAENKNGSSTARASVNKGSGKGERKASLPAQRGSLSGNKRNSVEVKKENVNGSVDDNNNKEEKDEQDKIKNEVKRKSIEVKKIEVNENLINNNIKEENKNVAAEETLNNVNIESKNNNDNAKVEQKVINETRKSINDMIFVNQGAKQEEAIKEEKIIPEIKNEVFTEKNPADAKTQMEKRQSVKQEAESKKEDNINASEKAENDVKVAEERKKSVVAESVISNENASAEIKKPEEFKVENTENKEANDIKNQEPIESVNQPAKIEIKSSSNGTKKSLLLSFSNKKSCALHLLIKSG